MNTQQKKLGILAFLALVVGFTFFKTRTESAQIAGFEKTDIEQLLKITGVTYDGTLNGLVQATQKAWLRPVGKELWEAEKIHEEKRAQLMPFFKKMGMVDVREPKKIFYTHILFMGATVPTMAKRLEDVQKIIASGVGYKNLAFLAGERQLTDTEKRFLMQRNWDTLPTTEATVFPRLFKEYGLPVEKMVFINAPATLLPDGTMTRPGMKETVSQWLTNNPEPGSVLVVSSQPFCIYQQTMVASFLPKTFEVEVMGYQAPDTIAVSSYLDSIARTLFQWEKGHLVSL